MEVQLAASQQQAQTAREETHKMAAQLAQEQETSQPSRDVATLLQQDVNQ